ncbi:MAG TPA: cysteine synthase family protein [Chloroflexota bacterium]|jgi:cysteine synthase A|nr:cysteine synthase family protein [Chloroflexota bacterium]
MRLRPVSRSIAEAIELPRVVRLGENLYAAAFPLMKLLPARFMLDRAREAGRVGPGSAIFETTSGTFGLALAILAALRGYRLTIVSDPAIDDPLKRRLEDLGARVEIVREPAAVGGFQRARLDRMAQLRAEHPDHFWPAQYDNPDNPGAYAPLVELLTETLGQIDCLVGTVGSGGSMCGSASYLRLAFPDLRAVGVDTPGSVLFGQPDRKRLLRGLGNSVMPRNLDHTVFDEVHWVGAAGAFLATRVLHRRHALFMGGTSGAAYLVADWWARRHRDATVVALLPDEGYRYQDTVYSDAWLRDRDMLLSELPTEPRLVAHPADARPEWSRFLWGGRTYQQVLGGAFHEGRGR